jgi:hypothetical protein
MPLQFTYTITYDEDHTPWGEPEIVAEETEKIANHEWGAYGVIVRVAGPVEDEESLWGCVVSLTDTGTYHELDAIKDEYLRDVAKNLAAEIESTYLDKLYDKRSEIEAMILQMGGC